MTWTGWACGDWEGTGTPLFVSHDHATASSWKWTLENRASLRLPWVPNGKLDLYKPSEKPAEYQMLILPHRQTIGKQLNITWCVGYSKSSDRHLNSFFGRALFCTVGDSLHSVYAAPFLPETFVSVYIVIYIYNLTFLVTFANRKAHLATSNQRRWGQGNLENAISETSINNTHTANNTRTASSNYVTMFLSVTGGPYCFAYFVIFRTSLSLGFAHCFTQSCVLYQTTSEQQHSYWHHRLESSTPISRNNILPTW